MKEAYITYAQRTAIGKFKGSLSQTRVDDLLASLISHFKSQCQFNVGEIDDVIIGCANQAGEDNRNLARMSSLLAKMPFDVPGTTLNRLCASSLDAVIDGWGRISVGVADALLIGGAENMSRGPFVLSKAQSPFDRNQQLFDTSLGWRFPNPKMEEIFPLFSMGETAEEVAKLHNISREQQDSWALNSHQKACKNSDEFKKEILKIEIPKGKKNTEIFQNDEGPRADTTLEKLAKLRPVFRQEGTVTAGNSASLNDGASLLFLVSEDFLKRHNLKPLARLTGAGIRGVHPNTMGLGPVPATQLLCKKFQIKIDEFDAIELNEAFSAQALACMKLLDIDPNKVNQRGGSLALGHPLGNSGTRILTTLIHILHSNTSLKKGLATMCVGVGQGVAVSIEKC